MGLRQAYTILIDDAIIMTCCETRKNAIIQEGYMVKEMIYVENSIVPAPHCGLGCLKGGKQL